MPHSPFPNCLPAPKVIIYVENSVVEGSNLLVNVAVGDANYIAFAAEKDPFALYAALVKEYMDLVAKVREIYDTVNALVGNPDEIPLSFGNKIPGFLNELSGIMALGVTDIDLPLPDVDGGDVNANLKDLMEKLEKVINDFCTKAESAQRDATYVVAAIATLGQYNPVDLNDYAAIKVVSDLLDAWINAYLAVDVADANGNVLEAIKNVSKVQIYLAEPGEYYVFLSEQEYNAAITVIAPAQDKCDAAKAEWNNIKKTFDKLASKWTIHDKAAFEAADATYVEFVKDYYVGKIVVTVTTDENGGLIVVGGVFGEIDAYAAFVAQRDRCYEKAAIAAAKAEEIKSLINAIATINYNNYADCLVRIAGIYSLIDDYKQYCADICDDCIPKSLRIVLAEKEAIALLYKYAAETKVKVNDATDVEIDKSVALYSGIILAANDGVRSFTKVLSVISTTLEAGKSAIDLKAPCARDDNAHFDVATDADHICDYCDKANVTECLVDAAKAHECDCGKASECADIETDDDHVCDVESCDRGVTKCAVANGSAHTCDCGATSECTDVDPADEKCDVCGEDIPVTPDP